MSISQASIPLNHPTLKSLTPSKPLDAYKIIDDRHKFLLESSTGPLKSNDINLENYKDNPRYDSYAMVSVNGKTVAKISNNGGITTSNAASAKIRRWLESDDTKLTGPALAQHNAEKIAQLLGGQVKKSASSITQAEFLKTTQAKTSYMTQQIAQLSENKENTSDSVQAFLKYMEMSTEEKYYESILKEMGLSKEKLDAMPPEECAKIEQEIQEKLKIKLENDIKYA